MNFENGQSEQLKQPEWFKHIQQWENSGKNQALYCQENNLSLASFSYWRTCYLKKQKPITPKKVAAFIPIKLTEVNPVASEMLQADFSSGLKLRIPLSMPLEEIVRLLKSLEHSHAN